MSIAMGMSYYTNRFFLQPLKVPWIFPQTFAQWLEYGYNLSIHNINWLPERCVCNIRLVIFELIWGTDILSTFCGIGIGWMPHDPFDDKSTLVQIMAWCRKATSHYLNQCLPWTMSRYGVTKPRRVKRHVFPCLSTERHLSPIGMSFILV